MTKSESIRVEVTPAIAVEPVAADTSSLVAKAKLEEIRGNATAKLVDKYIFAKSVWDLLVKYGGKEVVDGDQKTVCGIPCQVYPTRADAIRAVNNRGSERVGAMFV